MFKILSVYQIFCFQRTCTCPSIGIGVQNTLKVEGPHLDCAQILPCKTLSKWNVGKKSQVVIFQWMFRTLKVFCMQKSAANLDVGILLLKCWYYPQEYSHVIQFQACKSVSKCFARTHAKTWADAGTLKVKYPVNAENFKRILQRDGLIF